MSSEKDPGKFGEFLDAMQETVEQDPLMQDQPIEQTPPFEVPVDPLAHLIGRQMDPEVDKDPFTAMLDAALAAEGVTDAKSVETGFKNPESENHEWESKRETLFSGDDVHMICKKCFREMYQSRSGETTGQCMARHKISPNCAQQLCSEVMDQ